MSATPEQIGRYEIIGRVGRGGMGVLYRAHDPSLERDVAVKVMHLDFTTDSHARERFQREARAVARLQHPNIVTIHELGEVDDTPFIVMEYLEGQDLEALLKEKATLTLGRKLDIAAQLCEGLAYAHDQGIVHRDIKPGNVRVLPDGKVKILDFGIARFAASSLTQSGTVMGTPSYMAPEQIMGQPVDGRADLFSTGVLLYELLSGHKPFTGDSATAVAYNIMHSEARPLREELTDLPDAVNEIVSRALRKDPNERYAHAREMASDLQTVRMMLDLPLTAAGAGAAAAAPSSSMTTVIAPSDLFATSQRTGPPARTSPSRASALDDAPLRPPGAAPAGPAVNAPPAARPSPMVLIGAAIGVLLIAGWVAMTFMADTAGDQGAGADVTVSDGAGAGSGGAGSTGTGDAGAGGGEATGTETGGRAGGGAGAGGAVAPVVPQSFRVESEPAGAAIAIDGTSTGLVTPADVPLNGATPGRIELSLAGHDTLSADITAADLEAGSKRYELQLAPSPTRITVTASYPFRIVRGSTVLSETDTTHTLTVDPGGANVSAVNPELLLDQRLTINFRRQTQSFTLDEPGTLTVFAANEQCNVVAGGQDFGPIPVTGRRVVPGTHVVVLRCPDGSETRERARVTSGQDTRVTFPGGAPEGRKE